MNMAGQTGQRFKGRVSDIGRDVKDHFPLRHMWKIACLLSPHGVQWDKYGVLLGISPFLCIISLI